MTSHQAPRFYPTEYWHRLDDGRVECDLCPQQCQLREGKRGACFVRSAYNGGIVLTSYGRSSGFCIDPIEKKPLNHFYPGTSVLSFGTAGCNLGCRFCQNWNISKSRHLDTLSSIAMPEQIANAAQRHNCRSIAFTYNDPVIFHEYAVDTAIACREKGVKSVAVTAGYINPEPRERFFEHMDAVNIDLKAFTERFYKRLCSAQLAPVLDTLMYLYHETDVWIEITTLLIPDENDSSAELEALTRWVGDNLGYDVPLHFTAFHPDFKLNDKQRTPLTTLLRAREIGIKNGLDYVYIGNAFHEDAASTYCPSCGNKAIVRDWHQIRQFQLTEQGACLKCGHQLAGRFDKFVTPFGRQRIPVSIT